MKKTLAENFTVCYIDNEYSLLDILRDEFYTLDNEQLEIIKLLNGKYNEQEIINQFYDDSKSIAKEYLENLSSINAIVETTTPVDSVVIPSIKPYPELHSIHFEITGKCNLKCEHCYNSKHLTSVELTTEEIFSLIEQFKEIGVREVVISGGEAILRKDFKQIVNYLTEVTQMSNFVILSKAKYLKIVLICNIEILHFVQNDGFA